MRIRLLNDITILVMGHPAMVVGSKANTEKFAMIVVIVNQCSTINQTADDDGPVLHHNKFNTWRRAHPCLLGSEKIGYNIRRTDSKLKMLIQCWNKVLPMSQTAQHHSVFNLVSVI